MNKVKIIKNTTIFTIGFLNTITVFTLILVLLWLFNWLEIKQIRIGLNSLAMSFLLCLGTGVWEEIVFRYYFFGKLYSKTKYFWFSCLFTSFVFSLCHFPFIGYNYISFFSYLLGGTVYCIAYYKSKTIIYPIAIHTAWNYSQFFFSLPMSSEVNHGYFSIMFKSQNELFFGSYGIENGLISIVMRLSILVSCFLLIKLIPKAFFNKIVES
ncbi:MAG: CPBP family intramembrane metalloprotease [Sphingobacteriales bacterium]|nr:MAG: CPBP family intramembrane metalloprotease [Sphingobacteriales bacterium]